MIIRTWIYYFKHAYLNIVSNRVIHAISIGTITMSLLLFGSFVLLFLNVNNWLLERGQSLSMSVYVKEGIDQAAREQIEAQLKKTPGVELKGFISKEEAMMDLIEGLGAQSRFLDGLQDNPLPASFEIVFKDLNSHGINAKEMKEKLEKIEGIDEVQYSEQWIERFEGLLYILEVVGFIIGSFLCLAVLFITTNTIKLTIYSRREEIEILKLVGATDWFVKIPFLIEGAVQGLLGGILALLSLFLVYFLFALKEIHVIGLPVWEIVFLPGGYLVFILSLGLALGFVGSLIAVGRFFE
jgi:cell division transport system permease protein